MIRALLKKQLLELGAAFVRSSKTCKRRSRAGVFGYALLFIVLMLLVMLSFGAMALPMALTLVPQGLDWLYFVLMELSALTVSVLASAFTSYGHLFRCRDNQQLLAALARVGQSLVGQTSGKRPVTNEGEHLIVLLQSGAGPGHA